MANLIVRTNLLINILVIKMDCKDRIHDMDILEDSAGMDEDERELFTTINRTRSDQSFLGKLLMNKDQPLEEHRQLILDIDHKLEQKEEKKNGNTILAGLRIFKKQKKDKRRNQMGYRKNICGYITKKILREFVSESYALNVQQRCEDYGIEYEKVRGFYQTKIEHVTGPSHIPMLLVPHDQSQKLMKRVFGDFFDWFLKERYMRYLLIEGKMTDKKAYIEYKNFMLLSLVEDMKIQKYPESQKDEEPIQDSEMQEQCSTPQEEYISDES